MPWELMHEPAEDSGSDTGDRYRFQYQAIARHCCEFGSSELLWILCEWHTDYILALSGNRYVLVSVKHREKSQGSWTIARLCGDGGLDTLCARWMECRKPDQARLVTNGGLDPTAKKLAKACAAGDTRLLAEFSEQLYTKLGCTDSNEAQEFLARLRIEDGIPSRRHIRAQNIEEYARPMLRRIGKRNLDAGRVYDALVQVVEDASRSVATEREDVTWALSCFDSLDHDVLQQEDMKRRLITPDRVEISISTVPEFGTPLLQTGSMPAEQAETRLSRKLRQGEIGETTIQSARRTRSSWARFSAQFSSPLPHQDDLVDDLTTRVLHEAGMAEMETMQSDAPYGRQMLANLSERLAPERMGTPPEVPVDRLHLLGLAYQLTDECKVWWSPKFDIPDEDDGEVA
ncbi:dsDNA nuclease domain-containing protein [Streptomyces sp. 900105755]